MSEPCLVCRGPATHNVGGWACVCDKCCPGCGKVGQNRDEAEFAFVVALRDKEPEKYARYPARVLSAAERGGR